MKRYLCLVVVLMTMGVASTQWSMYRCNALQTGSQTGISNLLTDTLRWQQTINTSISTASIIGDVTADGIGDVIITSDAGSLYVFNGKTGDIEWIYATGAAIKSTPAIGDLTGDGILDVICGSHDKYLHVISSDGQLIWKKQFPARIENAITLFSLAGQLRAVVSSDDTLYCVNGDSTIEWTWTAEINNVFIHGVPSAADVDGDGVDELFVVAADFSNSCLVASINGDDGSTRWANEYNKRISADNVLLDVDGDGTLEVAFGLRDGNIWCLNADSGEVVWVYEVANNGRAVTPLTCGDMDGDGLSDIVFSTNAGILEVVRGRDAATLWTFPSGSAIETAAALADINGDDTLDVVFGTASNYLYVIQNSQIRWTHLMNNAVICAPSLADVDNDGILDLAVGDASGMVKVFGKAEHVPVPPYIYVQKTQNKDSVVVYWERVAQDTLGNPIDVSVYDMHTDINPWFVPETGNLLASMADTFFAETIPFQNRHYLNFAQSMGEKSSAKSNMGYVFYKSLNENTGPTSDRNWTSLPWHSEYITVSDWTQDVSPMGDPVIKITNLRDDQYYISWIWDPYCLEWFGTNFAIEPGHAYEIVTLRDTIIVLMGSNDPEGMITLNENSGPVSDRNWVSIPYNAVYGTVSDITAEYSPAGNPIIKVTNMREDQYYVSWIWDPYCLEWFGTNFTIEQGRGYEFIAVNDTVWNPTEHSNEAFEQMLARREQYIYNHDVQCGSAQNSDRYPVWTVRENEYVPITHTSRNEEPCRTPGVSHIIRGHVRSQVCSEIMFTAYRLTEATDVLTEQTIGSGVVSRHDRAAFWFDAGNFQTPWQSGEELIVVVEILNETGAYFGAKKITLDAGVDVQDIGEIELRPIPEPKHTKNGICWDAFDNPEVIGYSIYSNAKRMNDRIVTGNAFWSNNATSIRPVFAGGYETMYSSHDRPPNNMPQQAYFAVCPNPFRRATRVSCALSRQTEIEVKVYDVAGKLVRTVISDQLEPGYHEVVWSGEDQQGRTVAAGIYFIRENIQGSQEYHKIVRVR
ncbi:MAG: PQQ-binding-like beta-propeller repeat protein [candidate division WOR-3 bacterium]|nr:MAG: PQQ-binding-like beta-propeller repeat protein [candidate division WOR-3 bacterium]